MSLLTGSCRAEPPNGGSDTIDGQTQGHAARLTPSRLVLPNTLSIPTLEITTHARARRAADEFDRAAAGKSAARHVSDGRHAARIAARNSAVAARVGHDLASGLV